MFDPSIFSDGHLFWDCDPDDISEVKNRNFILGRALELGTINDVRWVIQRYGEETLKRFIEEKGDKRLSKKTLNFWKMILRD